MRNRMLFLLTAGAAVFALAGAAGARPPFGDPFHGARGGDHHERFFDRYADRLGVDDETRAEIEEKFDASREQAEPLRLAVHEAHRELHELLRADEPDRAAILAQADRIGELEAELRKLRLTTLLDVRGLLTEEQRAEMVSIHEERMRAHLEPLLEACADDVDALCPDVEDPRSLMLCIRERREELSESCRDAIGKRRRGHHGHFRPADPDGPPRAWDEG